MRVIFPGAFGAGEGPFGHCNLDMVVCVGWVPLLSGEQKLRMPQWLTQLTFCPKASDAEVEKPVKESRPAA